jgi:hypothetical protein
MKVRPRKRPVLVRLHRPEKPSETDLKLGMITSSYAEVLDATKHQDDKIGQLLTSIAFLTAATLAMAALESANFITRSFEVEPYKLPLALIALVAFLVGVAWSVMLLLVSLSTPLRVPGLVRSPRRPNPVQWVNGVKASQIYFYEMSRVSVDDWEHKWSAPAESLKEERLSSLIRETHNLGVRTSAKYDRTTEAVGILSIALLAFALSIVFVGIVAATPETAQPIPLILWQRLVIGGVFGCYAWFQTLGQVRYSRQAVDETPDTTTKSPERRKYFAELWYAAFIGLLLLDILEFNRSWPGLPAWIATTVVLAVGYLISFVFAGSQARQFPATVGALKEMVTSISQNRPTQWLHSYGSRVVIAATSIALVTAAIVCGVKDWYAGQLGIVSFAVLLIIGSAILQPTVVARRNRKAFWDNQKAAPNPPDPPSPDGT